MLRKQQQKQRELCLQEGLAAERERSCTCGLALADLWARQSRLLEPFCSRSALNLCFICTVIQVTT